MFCVFGYPHVAACVIGSNSSNGAAPSYRGASLVECTTRASSVMVCDRRMRGVLRVRRRETLAEDVRNGVFQVVPCFARDGT